MKGGTKLDIILLSLLNALCLAAGQILWKIGLKGRQFSGFEAIIKIIFSPLILTGILIYALATVLWLYILSKADISYAYPLTSIAHIIMFFCALLIFKEQIHITRWIGVSMIALGVFLIGLK